MAVAEFLAGDERVTEVFHPGLTSHQHHDVESSQMRGYGGMLSFSLHGGYESVKAFLLRL